MLRTDDSESEKSDIFNGISDTKHGSYFDQISIPVCCFLLLNLSFNYENVFVNNSKNRMYNILNRISRVLLTLIFFLISTGCRKNNHNTSCKCHGPNESKNGLNRNLI